MGGKLSPKPPCRAPTAIVGRVVFLFGVLCAAGSGSQPDALSSPSLPWVGTDSVTLLGAEPWAPDPRFPPLLFFSSFGSAQYNPAVAPRVKAKLPAVVLRSLDTRSLRIDFVRKKGGEKQKLRQPAKGL